MRLSPDMIASLSKEDAQKFVQQKMAEIKEMLDDCQLVMDHHRFVTELVGVKYLPKGLSDEERMPYYDSDTNLTWCGISEFYSEGGEWVSSSDYGDCG